MLKELNTRSLPQCGGSRWNTKIQNPSDAPETNHVPNPDPQLRSPSSNTPPRYENTQNFESPRSNFNAITLALHEARVVLDVIHNYTRHEVILRFRFLIRRYHPDKLLTDYKHSETTCAEKFKIVVNERYLQVEEV